MQNMTRNNKNGNIYVLNYWAKFDQNWGIYLIANDHNEKIRDYNIIAV